VASLEVFARAAIVAAIAILSGWLVERLLQPSGGSLVAVFTVVLGVIVIGCGLAYRRLRQPPSDLQLARLAEERQTDLDDVLVTATERLHAGKPGALDGLVVRSAVNRVREVAPDTVIAPEQMRRAGLRAGLAALALVVAVVVGFRPAWRAWNTALLIVAPPTIALKVEPGDVRLARGTALKIRARLEGLPAGAVPDAPTIRMLGAGESRALPMRADGAGYLFEVERINQSLRYQVRAGRLTSREYVATPVDPARVTRIDVDYTFPAFTKLTPRREEDGGDI